MDVPNFVILPYFSEEEIDRYELIANKMLALGPQKNRFEFLLAASPKKEPSDRLLKTMSRVAPCHHFQCPTRVFGYPEGPTAMFWDSMDYLNENDNGDGGFGLWFESDMIPAKSNWFDQIVNDWNRNWDERESPTMVMGCYVPEVYKKRFFRPKRLWVPEHINGGACYAKDFVKFIPARYRSGTFDMVIYEFLKASDIYAKTESIAFSTLENCRKDLADERRMLLHGFMQPKNEFINACLPTSTSDELQSASQPVDVRAEDFKDRIAQLKLRFVKRGPKAMLEALLMEQRRQSRSRAA